MIDSEDRRTLGITIIRFTTVVLGVVLAAATAGAAYRVFAIISGV